MQNIPWLRIVRRTLIVAFLFLILFALGDLLFIALSPLRDISRIDQPVVVRDWYDSYASAQQTEYWRVLFNDGPPIITRTVAISVTPTRAQVDFDLWLTRTHPCVGPITGGRVEEAVPQFTEIAFGKVTLEGIALSNADYDAPVWAIDPATQEMHVHLQAIRITNGYLWGDIDGEDVPPRLLADEFLMILDGVRLTNISPTPDSVSSGLVAMRAITPTVLGNIHFSIRPLSDTGALRSDRESNQLLLQRLGSLPSDIPLLSSLFYGLIQALPLMIFLYLVADQGKGVTNFTFGLKSAIVALLIFHFVLHLINSSSILANDVRWLVTLSSTVEQWLTKCYYSPGIHPLLGQGPRYVVPGVLGVVIPALLWQCLGARDRKRKSTVDLIVVSVSLMLPLAGIILARICWRPEYDAMGVPINYGAIWTYMLFFGSVIYLLTWGALEILFRKLASRPPRSFVAPIASLVIAAVIAWDRLNHNADMIQRETIGWLAVTVLLGTVLILSVLRLIRRLEQVALPDKTPELRRGTKALGIALVVLLTIPMGALVSAGWQLAYVNSIVGLAFSIDSFVLLIWFSGIVWILSIASKETLQIDASTRTLGLLGASSIFFSPLSHWLYLPITFLLGWFTLTRLLVRPASDWGFLEPLVRRVVQQRSQLIDKILDLNAAENAYREYREKQREKFVSGEISFDEYDRNLEERYRQLQELRQESLIAGHQARDVALAFGPHETVWRNAIHGTKFALLFAAPWIALALRDLLTRPMPQNYYPLWSLAYNVTAIVVKWGLYGFFFGYFYPYLRGGNGLQKGFWLFVAILLPTLPLAAISNSSATEWQATLFWTLQVFIQCMLLGLVAFDYVTLQRGGYRDWHLLFEVHDLPSVGVSVSSILVAIGAAVTTLLTTQATNLVSLALRFVIPQIPPSLPAP